MTKWTTWYNNQNQTTRDWLDKQSIWNDRDMIICGGVCFLIGVFFGLFA